MEHRLTRRQKAEPIRPAVIIRCAVVVLASHMQRVGSAVGGARASFIRTVLADEQPTRQRVVVRGKADRVSVPIAPRARLDRLLRMCCVEFGTQDRAITNTE